MSQIITTLMGASFRPAEVKDLIRNLDIDDVLTLERDPDNQYDPYAIKLLNDDGIFLGFVAKEQAAELAPLLDLEEATVTAVVVDTTNELKPILEINIDE